MNAPDTWHRGDWMQTFTGRQFYPLDPRSEDVDIVDIAHALSMLCRYNGHVQRFYSVAEHCVHLSHAVAPEHALWALLHDATEAYVGDMIRPLKRSIPEYVAVEDVVMAAIATRFNLFVTHWTKRQTSPFEGRMLPAMPPEVKAADTAILLNEREALLSEPPRPWSTDGGRLDVVIEAWDPARAKYEYLARFSELCEAAAGG